jgi:sulfoxide reductase catalytic subunit YedY
VPAKDLLDHHATPSAVWQDRRGWLLRAGAAWALGPGALVHARAWEAPDAPTAREDALAYNNYQEFSPDKKAVRHLARELSLSPWQLQVDGEVERPFTADLDDLARWLPREEHLRRLRCVEGWSAVLPWRGHPLSALIQRARPTSRARFVAFTSLHRPAEMIGQRGAATGLPFPYAEGLRIDEAMHPLVMLATGLYGEDLPPQNGAPLRVVVPWKYGFKSPKAVVRITLREDQPMSSWHRVAPSEYGFHGNVNPEVPHPRWSQARELRLGEVRKRPTLPFNGYAQEVAHLYRGQDPRTLF